MKILIASDVHGSAAWAKKLVECYRETHAEKLLLLGDILYHGPRNQLPDGYCPQETARLLNAISGEIICVKGNCDAEVDEMVLDFPIFESAVVVDGSNTLVLSHGHKIDFNNLPKYYDGKILLVGHTHVPRDEYVGKTRVINPGSVSIPKESSENACVLYDGGVFKSIKL